MADVADEGRSVSGHVDDTEDGADKDAGHYLPEYTRGTEPVCELTTELRRQYDDA